MRKGTLKGDIELPFKGDSTTQTTYVNHSNKV